MYPPNVILQFIGERWRGQGNAAFLGDTPQSTAKARLMFDLFAPAFDNVFTIIKHRDDEAALAEDLAFLRAKLSALELFLSTHGEGILFDVLKGATACWATACWPPRRAAWRAH